MRKVANRRGTPTSLLPAAKAAIIAGARAQALALLDGLRHGPGDDGASSHPTIAEALVATARGDLVRDDLGRSFPRPGQFTTRSL